jgi:hypothetical protein
MRVRLPKPSKRDQLVEATKELLWEVGTSRQDQPDQRRESTFIYLNLSHAWNYSHEIRDAAPDAGE